MSHQPGNKSLFLAALEIESEAERAQYLKEACGDREELRAEIESMLIAHDHPPEFVKELDDHERTIDHSAGEKLGTQVGPYKLLQQIGEGGFGVVYMAEQTRPVRRKVALKIIKPGMDTKEVVARFEAERQALALMDHPNIARVLDGGTTDSGRPYFVMDLVQGVPITDFCSKEGLSTRARLALFADVCRAVQHAHQKGIIHRDLKPSNIMVTLHDGKPVPKVIDFGVSKALSQPLTEKTLFTAFGQMLGTPLYMSPEQAEMSGLDVDTRSDVYSLGVLLYELLTGATPFDRETLKKAGFDEFRRMIREDEPLRPSARISTMRADLLTTVSDKRQVDPRRLGESYRGEVDWIVMKALEKDRNRRYETASAFAADIERHLNDQPVEACPPSSVYRLKKLLRRNSGRVMAAGVLFAALLIVLVVLAGVKLRSDQRQRQIVEDVRQSLTAASTAIEAADLNLATEHLAAAEGRIGQSPFGRPEFVDQIKGLRTEIQERRLAQQEFERFQDLARDAQDKMGYDDDLGGDLLAVDALGIYGVIDDDQWLSQLKNAYLTAPQQAEVTETAYELLVALADFEVRWSGKRDAASIQRSLNLLDRAQAFHEPTRAFFYVRSECHAFQGDETAAEEDRHRFQQAVGQTAWDYYLPGHTAGWRGDLEEAMRGYRLALLIQPDHFDSLFYLAMRLGAVGRDEEAAQVYRACVALRPDHVPSLRNRANTLSKLGRTEEALPLARKAVEFTPDSAVAHGVLGIIFGKQGKLDKAVSQLRRATELDPKLVAAHSNLGAALREQGKLDEAIACYRKAIELDPKLVAAHSNLGNALLGQEKLDEAIDCYRKAIELDPKLATAHTALGSALADQGKFDEAIECYRKAIELDPKFTVAYGGLGDIFLFQGQLDEAIECYQRAIELNHPNLAAVHNNLGTALLRQGKFDEAIERLKKAIEIDPKSALLHCNLGDALISQVKLDEAINCYRKAIELDSKLVVAHTNLGQALVDQGKLDEAMDCCQKAIELDSKCGAAYSTLGMILKRQGKWDEALANYSKAVEVAPNSVVAHNALAWNLANFPKQEFRDPDQAVAHAKKAVELLPSTAGVWSTLGMAQYRAGSYSEAIRALEKSFDLGESGDASDWFLLAMAQWRLDKKDQARKSYDKAIAWMQENPSRDEQELQRFRKEAEQLLEIPSTAPADSPP